MPNCAFNKVSKQLYWNRTSAWVFSCKFSAYFQNTFCYRTPLVAASAQPIKVDDAKRTSDNRGISWCSDSCKGKLLNLVSLTNLFEMLYPRLMIGFNIILKLNNRTWKNYKFIFLWKKWGLNKCFCSLEKSSKSLKNFFRKTKFFQLICADESSRKTSARYD